MMNYDRFGWHRLLVCVLLLLLVRSAAAQPSTHHLSGSHIYAELNNAFPDIPILAANGAKVLRVSLIDLDMQDNGEWINGQFFYSASFDPTKDFSKYREQYYNHRGSSWGGINRQLSMIRNVIIPLARDNNMKVIICLQYAPGEYGEYKTTNGVTTWTITDRLTLTDSRYRALFKEIWIAISNGLSSYPEVTGFDLMNEPSTVDDSYTSLMQQTIHAIRNTGARQQIIVEGTTSYRSLYPLMVQTPLSDPHRPIIYSFHVYPTTTPNLVGDLATVARWQERAGNPAIWIGEFGYSSFAPDAEANDWMTKATSAFRQYRWGGTYEGSHFGISQPPFIWDITGSIATNLVNFWK